MTLPNDETLLSKELISFYYFSRTHQEENKQMQLKQPDLQLNFTNTVRSINDSIQPNLTRAESSEIFMDTYISLYIYGGVVILGVILTSIRSYLFFKVSMLASKMLHAKMLHRILEAPLTFFTSNPCGRILNRFSKDMDAIDETLPKMHMDALQVSCFQGFYFRF